MNCVRLGSAFLGRTVHTNCPYQNVSLLFFRYLVLVDELDGVGGVLYSAANAVY